MIESPTGSTAVELRTMMSQFPSGVSIVCTFDEAGSPRGMTCSSLCSVSLSPPTLLICLRTESPTLEALRTRGTFSVNLLHSRAQAAAELFASGRPDRFELVPWEQPHPRAGPHLAKHAHAVADCEVSELRPIGDHTVVFGLTTDVRQLPGHRPLLYGLRSYRTWPG